MPGWSGSSKEVRHSPEIGSESVAGLEASHSTPAQRCPANQVRIIGSLSTSNQSSGDQITGGKMGIRFSTFPRTKTPPRFLSQLVEQFKERAGEIGTNLPRKGLTSDELLTVLRPGLIELGFEVEMGKRAKDRIMRPVFFGENASPELQYQIDAWHPEWLAGLEIEAGRAWMGNAVYRDLVQALVMVDLEYLILAVPQAYHYKVNGRATASRDYENTVAVADALYSHSRIEMPFSLCVIGY